MDRAFFEARKFTVWTSNLQLILRKIMVPLWQEMFIFRDTAKTWDHGVTGVRIQYNPLYMVMFPRRAFVGWDEVENGSSGGGAFTGNCWRQSNSLRVVFPFSIMPHGRIWRRLLRGYWDMDRTQKIVGQLVGHLYRSHYRISSEKGIDS